MIFRDRDDVEHVGRTGAWFFEDDYGLRARQLSSFWIYLDKEDVGFTPHARSDGFWEAWITLWMDRNVPQSATCIDIGANHGYYSFFLASRGCKVTAFEPQRRLAELLHLSNAVNPYNVNVRNQATSSKPGKVEMMVPIHHGMNATISNEYSYAPDGYETEIVEAVSLDDEFSDERIDFIKVDAEGAEDLIWAGSKKFRKANPKCVWLMEWRWDRYKNPEKFANEIFEEYNVTNVDYDGDERPVEDVEKLRTVQNEDWMLVLRHKD